LCAINKIIELINQSDDESIVTRIGLDVNKHMAD